MMNDGFDVEVLRKKRLVGCQFRTCDVTRPIMKLRFFLAIAVTSFLELSFRSKDYDVKSPASCVLNLVFAKPH